MQHEGAGPERRQSQADLELGKQHMIEMIEGILPLANMDAVKNAEANALIQDIKKTENGLELKKHYEEAVEIMEKFGIPQISLRSEDRETMRRILEEIDQSKD